MPPIKNKRRLLPSGGRRREAPPKPRPRKRNARVTAGPDLLTETLPLLVGAVGGSILAYQVAKRVQPKTLPDGRTSGVASGTVAGVGAFVTGGLTQVFKPDSPAKRFAYNALLGASLGQTALTAVAFQQQPQQQPKQLQAPAPQPKPQPLPPARQAKYVTRDELQDAVRQEVIDNQGQLVGALKDMRNAIASLAPGASTPPPGSDDPDRRDAAGDDERDAAGDDKRDAAGGDERDAAGDDWRDASGDDWRDAAGDDWRDASGDDWRDADEDAG